MKPETHQEPVEDEQPLISFFCSAEHGDILFDDEQISVLLQSCHDPDAADKRLESVRDDLFSLLVAAKNLFTKLNDKESAASSKGDSSYFSVEFTLTGASCSTTFPPAIFEKIDGNQKLRKLFNHIKVMYLEAAYQFSQIIEDAAGKRELSRENITMQSLVMVQSWYIEGGENHGA